MTAYKVFLDSSHIECKPNLVLLSKVRIYLEKNHHHICMNSTDADYIIINTCGFTVSYEELSEQLFHAHVNGKSKILSIGCLNIINAGILEKHKDSIQSVVNLDDLDAIFFQGTRFADVKSSYIDETISNTFKVGDKFPILKKFDTILSPVLQKSSTYREVNNNLYRKEKMFVEIGKGCVGNCSYCIIKKAKGNPISRIPDDIISDIARIFDTSKALYLVADDCGSYGYDIGTTFPELVDLIDQRFPGVRIDIGYLNPIWLKGDSLDKYLAMFRTKTISSMNISMQSGSDRIIQSMNRIYVVRDLLDILRKITAISPDTFIWTHFMVGFPGETWTDFRESIMAIRHFKVAMIFQYSDRMGTRSVNFPHKISNWVKMVRYFIALTVTRTITFGTIFKELLRRK